MRSRALRVLGILHLAAHEAEHVHPARLRHLSTMPPDRQPVVVTDPGRDVADAPRCALPAAPYLRPLSVRWLME